MSSCPALVAANGRRARRTRATHVLVTTWCKGPVTPRGCSMEAVKPWRLDDIHPLHNPTPTVSWQRQAVTHTHPSRDFCSLPRRLTETGVFLSMVMVNRPIITWWGCSLYKGSRPPRGFNWLGDYLITATLSHGRRRILKLDNKKSFHPASLGITLFCYLQTTTCLCIVWWPNWANHQYIMAVYIRLIYIYSVFPTAPSLSIFNWFVFLIAFSLHISRWPVFLTVDIYLLFSLHCPFTVWI